MVSMNKEHKSFTLRISTELNDALEAAAKEKELSLTAYVRMVLAEHLAAKAKGG